jgi:NAD(P)-dependent dehydrogenase (short-subunit alcohol dehydrogenase family)
MTLDAGSSGFTMIQMDVDDSSSVERGIDRILNVDGRLDVIVNNARIALAGAVGDAVWLKPFIPARLFEWAVMKYYRLH